MTTPDVALAPAASPPTSAPTGCLALPARRPDDTLDFTVHFLGAYTLRNYTTARDHAALPALISTVLAEYGLSWSPESADIDVVAVDEHYGARGGEMWVVETRSGDGTGGDSSDATVVASGGFYPVPHRGAGAVEIRKMYIAAAHRGKGIGGLVMRALEERVRQRGFEKVLIETASVLREACAMYDRFGYVACEGVETARCDAVLEKGVGVIDEERKRLLEGSEAVVECVDSQGRPILGASLVYAERLKIPFCRYSP
eukprot:CAMPEP_0174896586 /NCGR_PEP_ID=MMETSP0167-20121228/10733_1 /TAXON_ID=38298 /ORGANISM="Rhodella maculata, Strain CCMP736" /LENGTH=256 /DNA_ID=CAMNT_0016136181 /DNA_START=59 /DNA_END=829 /DNA_ORIENTATION=-